MDGTRDRPPGKTAENWSRKDGIRAGAVSGPWRSAPRDPETPHADAQKPAVGGSGVAARAPATGLRVWVALGVLLALGIVAAAVVFRITNSDAPVALAPAAPTAAQAPATTVEPAGTESEQVAAVQGDPALAAVTSVRLRIGPEFPPGRQAAILAALSEAGITAVQVEALPFEIATSRVGYYRAEDLAAAEALGRLVSPVVGTAGDVGVRDYGQLLADPEPGRLDLWVGG